MHEALRRFNQDVYWNNAYQHAIVIYECEPCEQVIYYSPYRAGDGYYREFVLPLPYTYYVTMLFPNGAEYFMMVGIAPTQIKDPQDIKQLPLPNIDHEDLCFYSDGTDIDQTIDDFWHSGFNHDLNPPSALPLFFGNNENIARLLRRWEKLSFQDLPKLAWAELEPLSEDILKHFSSERTTHESR